MQKVLHPGYFPVDACGVYPTLWRDFTLKQAMAAYWRVKSWNFTISNYSNGGGGSFSVIVGVDKMSDLVCSTFSSGSGTGSEQVLNLSGSVSPSGLSMTVECFDDIFFYYASTSEFAGSQPITITIEDQTILTTAIKTNDNVSASIAITATSFF
jgi:hypothetical protein